MELWSKVVTARTMLKQREQEGSLSLRLLSARPLWLAAAVAVGRNQQETRGPGSLGDTSVEVSLPHGREEQKTVSIVKRFIQAPFFFFNLLDCNPVLSCSLQNPVPWPGNESGPAALEVQNLSHWTREVPVKTLLECHEYHGAMMFPHAEDPELTSEIFFIDHSLNWPFTLDSLFWYFK